jgi:hypothetical protein
MVFQEYALFPWMTVAQNIAFGLQINGHPREAAAQEVERWLKLLRLTEFRDRYPKDLSGGMRQRVAIARCWHRPAGAADGRALRRARRARAARCSRSWSRSGAIWARPSSSSPTASRKPSSWPTASS